MSVNGKIQKFVAKRVTGENLVEIGPIFSSNGKILFVASETVIRAYSTQTGKHIRNFEGLNEKVVGVALHPSNSRLLLACSQNGELMQWKWETDLPPKKSKFKIPLKNCAVTGFHVAAHQQSYDAILLIAKAIKQSVQCMVFNGETGKVTWNLTNKCVFSKHAHSFAVGGDEDSKFAAGIFKSRLILLNLKNGRSRRMRIGGVRVLTCVTCHPHKRTVAAGDNTGRVLLWQGCMQATKCVYTVYHWHTLPVSDIAFSQEGSIFYSGGKERVLVKWTVVSPQQRRFLPRMAEAICHVAVAPDNMAIAVSLADNGIHILDAQLKLVCVIQHSSVTTGQQDLMVPYYQVVGQDSLVMQQLFPTGIHVDPRTRALVMNGRVGHIQFVDKQTSRLVYSLDVTNLTYATQERNMVVANVDVVKLAFSTDGLWLATVEQCEEPGQPVAHVRLKFWNFDVVKQNFSLNTSVSKPHFGAVHALQFQPGSPDEPLMAATSGEDNKLKLWIQTDSGSIYKEGMVWKCDSVGFFKNLPAGPLCFSADGSVLGVAFSCTLTLWAPETCQLKTNLTHSKLNSAIRQVVFGQLSCCHLVCVATDSCLAVWNLLTLTLDWIVPVHLSVLIADPRSMLIAAFTTINELFLFTPSSSELLLSQSELLPPNVYVVTAVFAPCHRASSYKVESQLVFLNSNQELMVLEKEYEAEDSGNPSALSNLPYELDMPTPFTAFLGKQRRTDVEAPEKKLQRHLGDPAKHAVRQLLTTPAHTMISVARLCQPFLLSFLATQSKTNQNSRSTATKSDDSRVDSDDSDDEADPASKQQRPAQTQGKKLPVVPEAERISVEERLRPLLQESFDWVIQLQPS